MIPSQVVNAKLTSVTRAIAVSGPVVDTDGTIFIDATNGDVTATLPTAVGRSGRSFLLKCTNVAGGHATIASAGGNVERAATYAMAYGESVLVQSDGTDWWVI